MLEYAKDGDRIKITTIIENYETKEDLEIMLANYNKKIAEIQAKLNLLK